MEKHERIKSGQVNRIKNKKTMFSFDKICNTVETILLTKGINPGSYTMNYLDFEKTWDELRAYARDYT